MPREHACRIAYHSRPDHSPSVSLQRVVSPTRTPAVCRRHKGEAMQRLKIGFGILAAALIVAWAARSEAAHGCCQKSCGTACCQSACNTCQPACNTCRHTGCHKSHCGHRGCRHHHHARCCQPACSSCGGGSSNYTSSPTPGAAPPAPEAPSPSDAPVAR